MAIYYSQYHKLPFWESTHESVPRVVKKISPKKPASARLKYRDTEIRASNAEEFTFFEVLNDPELDTYVGLKEKKPVEVYEITEEFLQRRREAKMQALLATKKEEIEGIEEEAQEKVQVASRVPESASKTHVVEGPIPEKVPDPVPPQVQKKPVKPEKKVKKSVRKSIQKQERRKKSRAERSFALQVNTLTDLQSAQLLQIRLKQKGFPTYLVTSEEPGARNLAYRVFIGKFAKYDHAKKVSNQLKQEERLQAVIVMLSE